MLRGDFEIPPRMIPVMISLLVTFVVYYTCLRYIYMFYYVLSNMSLYKIQLQILSVHKRFLCKDTWYKLCLLMLRDDFEIPPSMIQLMISLFVTFVLYYTYLGNIYMLNYVFSLLVYTRHSYTYINMSVLTFTDNTGLGGGRPTLPTYCFFKPMYTYIVPNLVRDPQTRQVIL